MLNSVLKSYKRSEKDEINGATDLFKGFSVQIHPNK